MRTEVSSKFKTNTTTLPLKLLFSIYGLRKKQTDIDNNAAFLSVIPQGQKVHQECGIFGTFDSVFNNNLNINRTDEHPH